MKELAGTGGHYDGVTAGDMSHLSHTVPDAGVSSHHHLFGATVCPPVNSDGTSCLCHLPPTLTWSHQCPEYLDDTDSYWPHSHGGRILWRCLGIENSVFQQL